MILLCAYKRVAAAAECGVGVLYHTAIVASIGVAGMRAVSHCRLVLVAMVARNSTAAAKLLIADRVSGLDRIKLSLGQIIIHTLKIEDVMILGIAPFTIIIIVNIAGLQTKIIHKCLGIVLGIPISGNISRTCAGCAVACSSVCMRAAQAAGIGMRMLGNGAGQLIAVCAVGMCAVANVCIAVPSDLISGSADGRCRLQIGILIVIGILSPENYGIVCIAFVREPLCRVGLVALDGGGQSLVPAGKGVADTGGELRNSKGCAILAVNGLRSIYAAVDIKNDSVADTIIVNINGRSAVGRNGALGYARAYEAGSGIGNSFGVSIDIAGQLYGLNFAVLVIINILIVVIDRISRLACDIVQVDNYVLVNARKIKGNSAVAGCIFGIVDLSRDKALGLINGDTVIKDLRCLHSHPERIALSKLSRIGLCNKRVIAVIDIVYGHGDRIALSVIHTGAQAGEAADRHHDGEHKG